MKKLLLSLTFLILSSINANSENKVVKVSNFDVPANEKWMVDRVLSENPDLKAADLSRVEFEAGTYYGQVNSSGVPNGHGILGSADEEDSAGKGIESNFKNGKIGKNEEPTIVSSTGETQTGAAAIEFQNRAFNNGFDVRIGLQSTLLDVLSNPDYMSNILENLGEPFVASYRTGPQVRSALLELQNLYKAENIDKELISEMTKALSEKIAYEISSTEIRLENKKERVELYEQQLKAYKEDIEKYGEVFAKKPQSLADIILMASHPFLNMIASDKYYYDDLTDELRYSISDVAYLNKGLSELKDYELKLNSILNFGFLQNPPTDNDEKLAAILLGIGKTDLELDDIRFNMNVNLRKDTTAGAIEGMINGKWYEIKTATVMGITGANIELQLTQKGKRDFDRDTKVERGDGGSGGSGEEMGGS